MSLNKTCKIQLSCANACEQIHDKKGFALFVFLRLYKGASRDFL